MFDLTKFTLTDMAQCSAALRNVSAGSQSMEAAAGELVSYLYEHLVDAQTQEKTCALVRFYKTHPYGELGDDLQGFARELLGDHPAEASTQCLTLLATAGDKPEWNARQTSNSHKAIPLPSPEVIEQIPMIAQLISQFGLELSVVVEPDPAVIGDLEQRTFNVFYVPTALGSPYVPAQEDFVVPFGIESALGFGGLLPSGELFAIIMFAKVHIPQETAEMFETLALSAKLAILPFAGGAVFS